MKQTKNADFLNAVKNDEGTSLEYRDKVPTIISDKEMKGLKETGKSTKGYTTDPKQVERVLSDYPNIKNEFINTLTNKVIRTDFFSKVFENPLKELKNGMLEYGTSIEQLFVDYAKAKGFLQKTGSDNYDSATALVGKKEVTVKAMYIERNFQYVFETTISDSQLKGAFLNPTGFSNLVNQITGSLQSGAQIQEYKDMILNFKAAADGKYLIQDTREGTKGKVKEENITGSKGVEQPMAVAELGASPGAKKIVKAVRALAGRLQFPSDKWNMAKVETFTMPEELVFLTTPEIAADIDVDVLATAFNVSATDIKTKMIIVDELPTQTMKKDGAVGTTGDQGKTVKPFGILCSRKFVQAIDTLNESRMFDNGRALYRNLFLHRQGIISTCYFEPCILLVETHPTA